MSVEEISKSFGDKKAVKNLSFAVEKGEAYGLLGPNGAGKSTTISMLFGLLKPDSGDVLVGNFSLKQNARAAKRLLGFVPQEIALYAELSAKENLDYWGRLYGLGGKALQQRIDEVLQIVDLKSNAKDRISTFSGGMKRRINIAAALMHEPQILIMDEPTVGIDPQSRNHILSTVKNLNEAGTTIIYTSHYMDEVEFLCSRIGIIDHGQIIAEGTVPELRKIIGEQSELEIVLSKQADGIAGKLKQIPLISQVKAEDNLVRLITSQPAEALAQAAQVVAQYKLSLLSINIKEPNLEAVFLHLTGRALRD